MFRASYFDTAGAQRWTLYGRLAGPWVDELRSCWRQVHEQAPRARAIVDLKEVTFVDQAGERLLAEMRDAGAQLIAAGLEHQYLIAMLDNRTAPEGGDK